MTPNTQRSFGTAVLQRTRDCGAIIYVWRKRLREQEPMRFALMETAPAGRRPRMEAGLELVLTRGERLRIGAGVDFVLLRRVLEVLRA